MSAEPLEVDLYVWWDDGVERRTLTVKRWPRETMIDRIFLEAPDPETVRVNGDEITFIVDNGEATYQIGNYSIAHLGYEARLVSSVLTERER